MISVGVREAKDRMYQLIELALAGEEVVITRRGQEVARIEAFPEDERKRRQAALDSRRFSKRSKGPIRPKSAS